MPQQPTIRRARPLDVVNLYRLVSEQGEFDPFDPSDEAGALRYVLDVIQNGHVLVAENKAGRLVATLGFVGQRLAPRDLIAQAAWFAVNHPYRGTVPAELLDLSIRAARDLPVHVPLPALAPILAEVATQAGFKPGSHALIWNKKNNDGIRLRRDDGEHGGHVRRRDGRRGRQQQPTDDADRPSEPVV